MMVTMMYKWVHGRKNTKTYRHERLRGRDLRILSLLYLCEVAGIDGIEAYIYVEKAQRYGSIHEPKNFCLEAERLLYRMRDQARR